MKAEIGVIGLGVMGKSLSRNLARNGFKIAIYNRHVAGKEEGIAIDFKLTFPELKGAQAFDNLDEFTQSLETPKKIILMVSAGSAVDAVLNQLSRHLKKGDIVIDAGNSHFQKSSKRMQHLKKQGVFLIGSGISGGELGALFGPSIMPSGDPETYEQIKNYLESIAAKDANERPCCTYVGTEGSGHFVKMIHNGIEYVEMQLLAECYFIMKNQGIHNEQIADVFESWTTTLNSYLLKTSIDILRKKEDDSYLLDKILDKAENKGTGKWASIAICDTGHSATMIPTALFARYLSFFKAKRHKAASLFSQEIKRNDVNLSDLEKAYFFARVINHHQGFELIDSFSIQNNWQINLSEIARIWTEGCIIKSDLMKDLVVPLKTNASILSQEPWTSNIKNSFDAILNVVLACLKSELHIPCLLEAFSSFNGLKTANGSANLIQAQRDFFGAHTYQRKNDSSGNYYHTKWDE